MQYIFIYVGFKRVTQRCRRTCKKESNSMIWGTSRSLHTDSYSTVKVWWVEMKKWGAQVDKKGWNSALVIFPYNFILFFVFLLQYGNLVDYSQLKFQLYVEFLVMGPWTSHFLRVAHAQLALPLPPNTFSTCPCWSAVHWVLQNNYGKVYACIFKVCTFIIQYKVYRGIYKLRAMPLSLGRWRLTPSVEFYPQFWNSVVCSICCHLWNHCFHVYYLIFLWLNTPLPVPSGAHPHLEMLSLSFLVPSAGT